MVSAHDRHALAVEVGASALATAASHVVRAPRRFMHWGGFK
jgi:hypothetical protein